MSNEFLLAVLQRKEFHNEFFSVDQGLNVLEHFNPATMIADYDLVSLDGEVLKSIHWFVTDKIMQSYYEQLIIQGYAVSYTSTFTDFGL